MKNSNKEYSSSTKKESIVRDTSSQINKQDFDINNYIFSLTNNIGDLQDEIKDIKNSVQNETLLKNEYIKLISVSRLAIYSLFLVPLCVFLTIIGIIYCLEVESKIKALNIFTFVFGSINVFSIAANYIEIKKFNNKLNELENKIETTVIKK